MWSEACVVALSAWTLCCCCSPPPCCFPPFSRVHTRIYHPPLKRKWTSLDVLIPSGSDALFIFICFMRMAFMSPKCHTHTVEREAARISIWSAPNFAIYQPRACAGTHGNKGKPQNLLHVVHHLRFGSAGRCQDP